MPSLTVSGRTFDARPDRIDYRDRIYGPRLVSLPAESPDQATIATHLSDYRAAGLILDQGREGSCTGFGLAAVINYLQFARAVTNGSPLPTAVSPRMLYQMARMYDEWAGEDYTGSSCRGAMKGWHRHGVCDGKSWPYTDPQGKVVFVEPDPAWEDDAATRPLGAYYRVNKDSIADMQSAIHEVGAIYVSAKVHKGWFQASLESAKGLQLIDPIHPKTGQPEEDAGGHAFALVGYRADGFIVQNSWGPGWGFQGFAILTYNDWAERGTDAWVAVMGAPMMVGQRSAHRSSRSLTDVSEGRASWWRSQPALGSDFPYQNSAVEPWDARRARRHTVVFGNNGFPINRLPGQENAEAATKKIALSLPDQWLRSNGNHKLAIYAHGGLNDEASSRQRVRVMAPYFMENGIYPIFITWRTGLLESIGSMIQDELLRLGVLGKEARAEGFWEDLIQRGEDALDYGVEAAARSIAKPLWTEMKENAAAAAEQDAGLYLLAEHLRSLKTRHNELEIHLIGHSAGSYIHGHLLDLLDTRGLSASSCTLYAPACDMGFALDHYATALGAQVLAPGRMYVHVMSEKRERADTAGPYRKSLLYLVSRALERLHKTPLLGMEAAWRPRYDRRDYWSKRGLKEARKWRRLAKGKAHYEAHSEKRINTSSQGDQIGLTHGSFDNDIDLMSSTLKRIRGSGLLAKVENLAGF